MRSMWRSAVLLLSLATAGCGGGAAQSQQPAPASPKPPVPAASAAASAAAAKPAASGSLSGDSNAFKADAAAWQRFKDGAAKEGKLTVTGPPFPPLRDGVISGLKQYGVTVDYIGLGAGEINTRIDREAKAGKQSIDIDIGGAPTCWNIAERNQVDDARGLVVDPALFDSAVWKDGHPRSIRPSPRLAPNFVCGMQTSEWVMTDLFTDKDVVPPSALKSWKDLLKPEFKGKIVAADPRVPGPGGTTGAYLYATFGEQYLKDLYAGQQVKFSTDARQLAEWVARGTYPIGLSLVPPAIEAFRSQGLPIERAFPDDGPGAITGGFSCVFRIKDGPNPNAAAVFLNWFASKDAQQMYENAMLEVSLRTDVPHKVPDYLIPKSGVKYTVDDYEPGYYYGTRVPAIDKLNETLPR